MSKKQKIWGIIIFLIIGANIVLVSILSRKAEQNPSNDIPTTIAIAPLQQQDQIYRLQFYARGSECGLYINGQLVYDTYGNSIGSLVADYIDNINNFLHNGENRFELKLLSRGNYFEPGDEYQCRAWIKAGRGRTISEVVAYLNINYAGINLFTMGDSAQYEYLVPTNFKPQFQVVESAQEEKAAMVSGTLTLHNLPEIQDDH